MRIRAFLTLTTILLAVPAALAQQADRLRLDGFNSFQPTIQQSQAAHLRLAAHLAEGEPEIPRGLIWRVFGPEPGADGKLPLIASAEGGSSIFELDPGSYLVHSAFGRAGATKRITLGAGETRQEHVILDAGGLKLNAVLSGGMPISPDKLRFSIYEAREDPREEKPLVLPDVNPNSVIRLNAGTYHIVSSYGTVNAVVRSDIRVEAGKLTEAEVEHRAAQLTLKLVRDPGGEALADTHWTILTESGDMLREHVGAFMSMILAEGNYTVIARNRERTYTRDFEVVSGRHQDVEVLAE